MSDREKVMNGLSICSGDDPDCQNCPYYGEYGDGFGCETIMQRDAVSLLKSQEPRVMTLEEWWNAPEPLDGECMCYEIKNKGLEAVLVKVLKGCKALYGKEFRCWTSRPTDEQRKAVKWVE